MGNTCMGNPRKGKSIMKESNEAHKRYKDYESTKVKKEMVAAQIEGEQVKISKNLFVCSICMLNYNLAKRQPVIVCNNHHTYCRECMESASLYNRKCPQCRSDFLPLLRNRDIYQLVEDNQKQLQQDKLPVVKEQSNFLVLTIDQKNKFICNFWIEGNRIMKIDDDQVWEGFMSNQSMLRDRQCIFSVKVIKSKFNNIQIGLVGKGYRLEKNITCKQSVVYHLADGMILEGIAGRSSEWKPKGKKVEVGKPVSIEVRVNIPSKTICWLQQENQLGKARLSDYILEHECVAYILMSHKEDILELNA